MFNLTAWALKINKKIDTGFKFRQKFGDCVRVHDKNNSHWQISNLRDYSLKWYPIEELQEFCETITHEEFEKFQIKFHKGEIDND